MDTEGIGYVIGGDFDDYITQTYQIPSVTSELGSLNDYKDKWWNKSPSSAKAVIDSNQEWITYIYQKLGSRLKFSSVNFEQVNNDEIRVTAQVKNEGFSGFEPHDQKI